MNLLPKSHHEFSEKDYWDVFFKKRGSKAFEWYGEYPELAEPLHNYMKPNQKILIVGCGNSTLGFDLHDTGFTSITNIDISPVVIKQMNSKMRASSRNAKHPESLQFLQMDALSMSFENDAFNVILDKGTLDALASENQTTSINEEGGQVVRFFSEIDRCVQNGGRYICISLLQAHVLKAILAYFPAHNWMFRVIRCVEVEAKATENGETNSMPVFMVICTKFKSLSIQVLELDLSGGGNGGKLQRVDSPALVLEQISSIQQAAFICNGLRRSTLDSETEISLDLYAAGVGGDGQKPRFTMYILDEETPNLRNNNYGAFIVPQGRESEWLFSTKAGRKHFLKLAKFNRLAMITMHRDQRYGDFELVKEELSEAVRNLVPPTGHNSNAKIPFLSIGSSDMGQRTVRHEGRSPFSGDYVIEDVECDNNTFYRRLYFLSNQLVIQSEAKLIVPTKQKIKESAIVDLTHLTCQHHIYMSIAALVAVCDNNNADGGATYTPATDYINKKLSVIGLGGGGLCSFLHKLLPTTSIVGVEIDQEIHRVASDWFGLCEDENLKIVIQDGVEYLSEHSKLKPAHTENAILIDVDSKDTSIGMSCPPKVFLSQDVLNNCVKILSQNNNNNNNNSVLVVNVVLRDESLREGIVKDLRKKFVTVISYKLEEDLNEIFFCFVKKQPKLVVIKKRFSQAVRKLNQFFTSVNGSDEGNVDVDEFLERIKIC